MRTALLPRVEEAQKNALKAWLRETLQSSRLTNRNRYPLGEDQIGIYVDGRARPIRQGQWDCNSYICYVGQESSTLAGLTDRLAILGAIISAVGLWSDLTEEYSTAISRILLETYNEMMGGLVSTRGNTAGVVVGLAFHNERRMVAARFADDATYYQPNGEAVEVGDSWVTVEMPAARATVTS